MPAIGPLPVVRVKIHDHWQCCWGRRYLPKMGLLPAGKISRETGARQYRIGVPA